MVFVITYGIDIQINNLSAPDYVIYVLCTLYELFVGFSPDISLLYSIYWLHSYWFNYSENLVYYIVFLHMHLFPFSMKIYCCFGSNLKVILNFKISYTSKEGIWKLRLLEHVVWKKSCRVFMYSLIYGIDVLIYVISFATCSRSEIRALNFSVKSESARDYYSSINIYLRQIVVKPLHKLVQFFCNWKIYGKSD